MERGRQYLVKLETAPTLEPKEGGWALIRLPERTIAVSPVVSTRSPWARSVHVVALANGPDPTPGRDELSYRDEAGEGESRIIESFIALG